MLGLAGLLLAGCTDAGGDPGPSTSVTEDHGDGTTGPAVETTPPDETTEPGETTEPVTADPGTGRCSDPIASVPTRAVGEAPLLLQFTGLVAVGSQGASRWVDVVLYADGTAARYNGGFADPWKYASQRQLATEVSEHEDLGAEVAFGGYLDCDLDGLMAALAGFERDNAVFGTPLVPDAANTEMVLFGDDGAEEFVWDVYSLGLERDAAGVVVDGLDADQVAARDALSAFGSMLLNSVVDSENLTVDRIEVLAPYAITDAEVTWPGPPITDVLHDGCGVLEGADAERIWDQVQAETPIADPNAGVFLRVLTPQVEPCVVHQ